MPRTQERRMPRTHGVLAAAWRPNTSARQAPAAYCLEAARGRAPGRGPVSSSCRLPSSPNGHARRRHVSASFSSATVLDVPLVHPLVRSIGHELDATARFALPILALSYECQPSAPESGTNPQSPTLPVNELTDAAAPRAGPAAPGACWSRPLLEPALIAIETGRAFRM